MRHKNFRDKTGEKWVTNEGYTVCIVNYFGVNNCTIEFEDGGLLYKRYYLDIVAGLIRNPNHKSVCGVGFIGYGEFKPYENLVAYSCWKRMLQRCYCPKFLRRNPTYKGCTVHKDWHSFQNFCRYFNTNYIEGFVLDKDILSVGNKTYSEDTSCFIPHELNSIILKSDNIRGDLPIGVSWRKDRNKYTAQCKIGGGKSLRLGCYNTPEEAFNAYKVFKESRIREIVGNYKGIIDNRIYEALMKYEVKITD